MGAYKSYRMELNEEIEALEQKCNSLSFRISNPAQYKKDYSKLERLRKRFVKDCQS
jgi:hypothetical protein